MTNPNSIIIKEIGDSWNKQMLSILEESPVVSGGLKIHFDKQPDIFLIPKLRSEYYKCVGFFIDDLLVGFAMMVYYEGYVNSKPQMVMYFCNMYIKKEGRKKNFYFKASDQLYKSTYKNASLGYTLVMKGNKAAESYIGRRDPHFKHIPYSRSINSLVVKNIIITFKKKLHKHIRIRKATGDDIFAIVNLLHEEYRMRLFGPKMNEEIFRKNLSSRPDFDISNYYVAEKKRQIIGVCSAWDTRSLRQNRVLKYSSKLKFIRFFYRLLSFFFGFPPLPDEGKSIKDVTINEYAVDERDPEIFRALISKIYDDYRKQKYNIIIFGSCGNDPLLKAINGFLHTSIESHIVQADKSEEMIKSDKIDISLPYVDVAMM